MQAGIAASEHFMPRSAEDCVAVGDLSEHLHRECVHEIDARRYGATILNIRAGAIGLDIFAEDGGVEVEGAGSEKVVDGPQAVDIDVLFDNRVVLGESEHPKVRG